MKNKAAQKLGKLSAKKRKANGHDKAYYSALAKKRWDKVRDTKALDQAIGYDPELLEKLKI